jgi:hypothetical protein
MPNVNFSENTQQVGNNTVGLKLLKGEYKDYYPAKNNFLPMLTENKGNVVFRCTYFHYLMMGAPTAITFRYLNDEKSKEKEVDFEIPPISEDGIIHVEIEAPDTSAKEVYKLRITSDPSMKYEDNLFSNMDVLPAENTIELLANGKVKINLPAVSKEYEYTSTNTIKNIAFSRNSVSLIGEINEVKKNGEIKYGPLTSIPSINGSKTEKKSYTDLPDAYYESYSISMNSPKPGTPSNTGYYDITDESYFNLTYDAQTGKLKNVNVHIYGNWFKDYSAPDCPQDELDSRPDHISISFVVED